MLVPAGVRGQDFYSGLCEGTNGRTFTSTEGIPEDNNGL